MKKILVPTDFSENAQNALLYAVELAKLFSSQIELLHTFHVPKRAGMLVSIDDIIRSDAAKELETLRASIPNEIHFDTKVLKGTTAHTIADYADRNQFDLIVMGTQGSSGLEEIFIGSITGAVMRHTETPILAIPENFRFRPIGKIVFALANLQLGGMKVVAPLKQLAKKFGASVIVFHHDNRINNEEDMVFDVLEWLQSIPLSITFDQETEKINDSIRGMVDKSKADLLCMVRRKRNTIGFFERLFKESVTSMQIFHCEIPLLILHSD